MASSGNRSDYIITANAGMAREAILEIYYDAKVEANQEDVDWSLIPTYAPNLC